MPAFFLHTVFYSWYVLSELYRQPLAAQIPSYRLLSLGVNAVPFLACVPSEISSSLGH